MSEKLQAIKASISASLRRTQAFYSSHRTLLLSGLTVLSILLIVWARLGFTLQFGKSFAGAKCTVVGGQCMATCGGSYPVNSTDQGAVLECVGESSSLENILTCCVPGAGVPVPPAGGAYKVCSGVSRPPLPTSAPDSICARPAAFDAYYSSACPNPTRGSDGEYYYLSQKTREDGSSFGVPLGCVEHPDNCPEGMLAWSSNYCLPTSDPRVGGATPTPTTLPVITPGGRPAAAALSVICAGSTAKLDWNIPAGVVENVIQKNINNQGWQIAYSDPTKAIRTFSETFVATTVYRHKTDPNVVSNSVQCPSAATTPTPAVQTPSVLTATCGATQNKLDWTLPAGHDSNSLQRKLGATGSWTTIGTGFTLTAPVSFTDSSIQSGQTYIYRHKAWASTPSNEVTCLGPTPTPTATVSPSPSPSPSPIPGPSFVLALSGRNATTASAPSAIVQAQGGQQVEVIMLIRNTQATLNNVMVRATLPAGLTYVAGSTSVAGTPTAVESITAGGLSLGALGPQQETTVVFRARVVGSSFVVGTTQVEIAVSTGADNATQQNGILPVIVTRAVAGVPGTVKTGPGDAVLAALLMSAIMTLLYVSYTHSSAYKRKEIEAITRDRDPMDFRS